MTTLQTINEILGTNYTTLDDVPTDKLNRIYMILRIAWLLEEHKDKEIDA